MKKLPAFIGKTELMLNQYDLSLKADEIQFPKLVPIKSDHAAGGLISSLKVSLGQYEPMETSFKVAGIADSLLSAKDICKLDGTIITFRGDAKDIGSCDVKTAEVIMRGSAKEWDMGQIKTGEKNASQVSFDITYFHFMYGGKSIIERDDLKGTLKINGVEVH